MRVPDEYKQQHTHSDKNDAIQLNIFVYFTCILPNERTNNIKAVYSFESPDVNLLNMFVIIIVFFFLLFFIFFVSFGRASPSLLVRLDYESFFSSFFSFHNIRLAIHFVHSFNSKLIKYSRFAHYYKNTTLLSLYGLFLFFFFILTSHLGRDRLPCYYFHFLFFQYSHFSNIKHSSIIRKRRLQQT